MDKRKIEKFKKAPKSVAEVNIQNILNSSTVNQSLLHHAYIVQETDFILRQKAQLSYMEALEKGNFKKRLSTSILFHDYLWAPTPAFYVFTLFLFSAFKMWKRLPNYYFAPFLMLPITMDYYKREGYVRQFKEEYETLQKSQKIVAQLLQEKTNFVTVE